MLNFIKNLQRHDNLELFLEVVVNNVQHRTNWFLINFR
jgi:hypothetical protein